MANAQTTRPPAAPLKKKMLQHRLTVILVLLIRLTEMFPFNNLQVFQTTIQAKQTALKLGLIHFGDGLRV